jgi:hypothetical protein
MRTLGIYVDLLPANEASLLRSIIRLSSDLGGRWQVTDGASECDVIILDGDTDTTLLDIPGNAQPLVASRAWRDSQDTMFIGRPFRADSIIAVLGQIEARLTAKLGGPSNQRARLKRWPAQHVAGDASSALRMATVLSRVACTPPELAKRLALPLKTCDEFMAKLDRDGFLVWDDAKAEVRMANAPKASPPAAIGAGKKLLGAIGRKLGIGWLGAHQ